MSKDPKQHALLELEMRRRLVGLVRSYPGIHAREAARQLGTSIALVEYHIGRLSEAGLVRVQREDRYLRMFAADAKGPTPEQQRMLAVLRQPWPLRITLHLLDLEEPARHGDVAHALDLGKSKLSFHLRKLEAAGIVRKRPDAAFELADARLVHQLLLTYKPTQTLRDEFADVWLDLYGE